MRYFFMTKYSTELKIEIVVEYMTDGLSSYTLEKKYKVSARQIRKMKTTGRLLLKQELRRLRR